MKKMKIIFVMFVAINLTANAQVKLIDEYKQPPKKSEIVIDVISHEEDGGYCIKYWKSNGNYSHSEDHWKHKTDEQLLEILIDKAKKKYSTDYPNFFFRDFQCKRESKFSGGIRSGSEQKNHIYVISASVVIPDPKALANENLSKAIDKALSRVREGSRLAIDNVSVSSEINREDYKDQVIDVLLDKGYKVVAKEYLEKLMKEQENQRSGIYNDNTTVTDNNFTAVGYFINVKVTESSLRVQVVNVSTGEYEGNATINF